MQSSEHVNALDAWKRRFDLVSSEFSDQRKLYRAHVDFVYDVLRDFWGMDFFIRNPHNQMDKDDAHFLFPMLGSGTFASFYYLTELSMLISYAKERHPSLYNALLSVRFMSNKAKEVLFEMYIGFIFELNQIPYQANVPVGDQWKDGYCLFDKEVFLVECKKKYSVISEEIAIRKFLIRQILKIANQTKFIFEGIGVVTILAKTYNQNTFMPMLRAFKNFLATCTEYRPGKLLEDETIRFEFKALNDANRIELENHLIDYTLYFTVHSLYSHEGDDHFFNVHLYFRVKTPGEKVVKKLLSAISNARKQHAGDKGQAKLFFIDNEYLNDFVTPLLDLDASFEEPIRQYLNKRQSKDFVVLLTRNYTGKRPVIKAKVIARDGLDETKRRLEEMTYYAIHEDFFKLQLPKPG